MQTWNAEYRVPLSQLLYDVDLSKWASWQSTPGPTFRVTHSNLSTSLVKCARGHSLTPQPLLTTRIALSRIAKRCSRRTTLTMRHWPCAPHIVARPLALSSRLLRCLEMARVRYQKALAARARRPGLRICRRLLYLSVRWSGCCASRQWHCTSLKGAWTTRWRPRLAGTLSTKTTTCSTTWTRTRWTTMTCRCWKVRQLE